MDQKTRERVLRNFVAATLMSDLSKTQMREIADDLANGTLSTELSLLLWRAIEGLRGLDVDEGNSRRAPLPPSALDLAISIIERRDLTRSEVEKIVATVAPKLQKRVAQETGDKRAVLTKFFSLASLSESQRFLTLLNGEEEDPFLKGISRRR